MGEITKVVLSKRKPGILDELSEEHRNILINCHSYLKYWWYRKLFELRLCPLCVLLAEIYPKIYPKIHPEFEHGKNYHWTIVEDTFAEKKGRALTVIIVYHEHVSWYDWNSLFACGSLHIANDWLYHHKQKLIYEYGAAEIIRIGDSRHSVDTTPEHVSWTFVVPDGTDDVSIVICKGPRRKLQIRVRAQQYAMRYQAGEIPE